MTYASVIAQLGFTGICMGSFMLGEVGAPTTCGLSANAHRGIIDPFNVVHWSERRVTKRGLRRLLLLVAKRDRLTDPGFLNSPDLWWAAMYLDERKANEWAAQIGARFPVHFSLPERRVVALVDGLSRTHPAVYAWANRRAP